MNDKRGKVSINFTNNIVNTGPGTTIIKVRGDQDVDFQGSGNHLAMNGGKLLDVDGRPLAGSLALKLGLPENTDPRFFIELFEAINKDKKNPEPIIKSSYLYKIASIAANFEPLSFIANVVSLIDSETVGKLLNGISD